MPLQQELGQPAAAPEMRTLLRTIVGKVRQHARVPFTIYARAMSKLPLSTDVEMMRILGVSRATLQRTRAQRSDVDPVAGDRLARALRLQLSAVEAFGGKDDASVWMTTPNPSLNGARPIDLASEDAGAQQVEMALWRVRDGMPA